MVMEDKINEITIQPLMIQCRFRNDWRGMLIRANGRKRVWSERFTVLGNRI